MKANELRQMYLDFFKSKGHSVISGASLIPENDPTVLFTTAGMHPLVPYLLGEIHPAGKRLCNVQKCIRTGDIDDVGDASHLTFFEMLGNWSLGDYFKKEAIEWSFEFLTSPAYLGLNKDKLSVTVFEGNETVARDEESAGIWKGLGIPESRIFALPIKDNWWGPAGKTGPCGPDTEMFIDTGKQACGSACRPGCGCGKYFEVWNDVFMQYEKTESGDYVSLKQSNVDTGMGVERTTAMLQGKKSVYETELFAPIFSRISDACGKTYGADAHETKAFRIVADHVRSSVFILGDVRGVVPSNLGQGYVLRRLIRRAVRFGRSLGLQDGFLKPLAESVIDGYAAVYPELSNNRAKVLTELTDEEGRFDKTLARGMVELDKVLGKLIEHNAPKRLSGKVVFNLYDTYGFPMEITAEICQERGFEIDREAFEKAFDAHRDVSRQGSEKVFKGGLADDSVMTTRLHTATPLLHQSLRTVLGNHVEQKGSNITTERLRFDFTHPDKMTSEQVKQVEEIVNTQIQKALPVTMETMTLEQARQKGSIALFDGKYEEQVKVYTMGGFSMEVCGGPHAANTLELGRFKILKEESSSAGVRRIRAVLEEIKS
jgi:alanyl-tRNA synthetase